MLVSSPRMDTKGKSEKELYVYPILREQVKGSSYCVLLPFVQLKFDSIPIVELL